MKRSDTEVLRNTSAGIDFAFRNEYYKDMVFSIPFIAKYQVMNSALALKTIEVLQNVIPVSVDQIHAGIAGTRWQGRMETVLPGVIVDGAHNEDGVEKFVETAEHFQKECPLTLLFSAVDDKDYTDMIHTICSRITFRHVVVTSVADIARFLLRGLQSFLQKRVLLLWKWRRTLRKPLPEHWK